MVTKPSEEVSHRLAYELGALMLNFGGLEHCLSLVVAACLDLNDMQERSLVRGMFARAKLEWIQGFAKKFWNEEFRAKLKELAGPTFTLIDYRNDFAHGHIMHDVNGNFGVITFRGQHRYHGQVKLIDMQELGASVALTQSLAEAFHELSVDVTEGKAKATPQPSGGPQAPKS